MSATVRWVMKDGQGGRRDVLRDDRVEQRGVVVDEIAGSIVASGKFVE
jgi:hypothetical protein